MFRNLPTNYNPNKDQKDHIKFVSEEEVKMKSNLTGWVQIFVAVLSILGGAIWHIGKLSQKIDSGFENTQKSISELTNMQKDNAKKFEMIAESLIKNQVNTVINTTSIKNLEKQTEKIENRMEQIRTKQGKRR